MEAIILIKSKSQETLAKILNDIILNSSDEVDVSLKHSDNAVETLTEDIADYISIKYGIVYNELKLDVQQALKNKEYGFVLPE